MRENLRNEIRGMICERSERDTVPTRIVCEEGCPGAIRKDYYKVSPTAAIIAIMKYLDIELDIEPYKSSVIYAKKAKKPAKED